MLQNDWSKRMNWCKKYQVPPADNFFWELSKIGIKFDLDLHQSLQIFRKKT